MRYFSTVRKRAAHLKNLFTSAIMWKGALCKTYAQKMQIYGVRAEENRMYYIYRCKSKYTGKGESIENQVEMCKEYLFSHIKDIDEKYIVIYEDEGFLAKKLRKTHI